jgi:iron(III) transport system substrate-binding protein
MKKQSITGLAGVAALLLTGCADMTGDAGSNGPDPEALGTSEVQAQMDELYQQAQDNNETSVVTYGPTEESYVPAYEVFMERYPEIQVQSEYIFGAELAARLDQEFASGNRVGSIQNGGPALTQLTYSGDRCQAYEPFTISTEEIGADNVSEDNEYRALSIFPFGIAYNTDKVSEEEAPKSFSELTDPKWQGQMLVTDPHRVNGFTNSLAAMVDSGEFDMSWTEGIAQNDPLVVSTSALAAQSIARGERGIDVMGQYNQYQPLIEDGLPIGFVFPTEDAVRAEYHYSCLLKDNPTPAATELLYNWLYTEEGQNALAEAGVYGVRPDSTPPEGLPPLEDFRDEMLGNVPVPDAAKAAQEVIAQNKPIFG